MNMKALRVIGPLSLLTLLGGCFGAYQVTPDDVQMRGGLTPNVEDKYAGLVALAPSLDSKTYKVIAVGKFPVTDPAIKDDPTYTEHWKGRKALKVTIEHERIVLERVED